MRNTAQAKRYSMPETEFDLSRVTIALISKDGDNRINDSCQRQTFEGRRAARPTTFPNLAQERRKMMMIVMMMIMMMMRKWVWHKGRSFFTTREKERERETEGGRNEFS